MDSQLQFAGDVAVMLLPDIAFDRAAGREELAESQTVQAAVPTYALVKVARFETGLRSRQRHRQFGLKAARQGVNRLRLGVRVGSALRVLSAEFIFGSPETRLILGDRAVYRVLRDVKRQRAVEVARRQPLPLNRRTHVISKRLHPGEMATDARTPVADQRVVGLIAIRHDFERGRVNAPTLSVGQEIGRASWRGRG